MAASPSSRCFVSGSDKKVPKGNRSRKWDKSFRRKKRKKMNQEKPMKDLNRRPRRRNNGNQQTFVKVRSSYGSFFIVLVTLALQLPLGTLAIKNEFLTIKELCSTPSQSFLSNIPRVADGAVVTSKNERDVDCVITFQTESILERFMIRFENLAMDCNDKLVVYDGAHAIGAPKANLSCEKTATSFGINGLMYTTTNYVTLRYNTDSWGTDQNGFTLVVTAFRDTEVTGCRNGFKCDHGVCIDNDLVCDTVNHCGNAADERHSQFCSLKRTGSLFSAIMSVGRICPCQEQDKTAVTALDDRGKNLARHSAVGFPHWLNEENTASLAIILAVFLIIVTGVAIACWINSCRKRGLQTQNGHSRTTNLRMNTKGVNGEMYAAAVQATSEMQTQYTSTSLMATGNTHHIFDSVPPIQDDPFQQSSDALTQMIDNLGNAHHPVDRRGFMSTATIATTIRGFFKTSVVEGLGVPRSWPLPILIQTAAFRHQWRRLVALIHKCWLPT